MVVALRGHEGVMTRELGAYVKRRRDELGRMSQEHVALEIGKSQEWVSRLERGSLRENLPDPEVLERLARVLDVTPQFLIETAGYETTPEPPQTDAEVYTAVMQQVSMSGLPPKVKALIRGAIDLARDINESNGDGPTNG